MPLYLLSGTAHIVDQTAAGMSLMAFYRPAKILVLLLLVFFGLLVFSCRIGSL